MLIQLSQFFSFAPFYLVLPPFPPAIPPLSSCPWVVHTSYLASPFLYYSCNPPVYFIPSNYASYSLHLCPHSPPSLSQLITLQMTSISMILFLFCCLLSLVCFLDSVANSCEFIAILMLIF